ncbi:ShlB/FhaC/HecB family hemolysin secretion/activation protein, partial [Salmonella enterica]
SLTVSQGLGRFGPRPITVPLSRDGAHPGFSRIEVAARVLFGLPGDTALTLSGRAQSSFGAALYRNEQFSLEGEGAVSAYVGGL